MSGHIGSAEPQGSMAADTQCLQRDVLSVPRPAEAVWVLQSGARSCMQAPMPAQRMGRQELPQLHRLLLGLGAAWEPSVLRPRKPEAVTSSRKLPSKAQVSLPANRKQPRGL